MTEQEPVPCAGCGKLRTYRRSKQTLCHPCALKKRFPVPTFDTIDHGTQRGFFAHFDHDIPMPDSCGCKQARREAQQVSRLARTSRHIRCTDCQIRRECREDRGGRCASCWKDHQKEVVAFERQESADILENGEWVNVRGVMRWFPRGRTA